MSVMKVPKNKPVDVYFYNAGLVAENLPYSARVRYRYFSRKPGMFFGTPFIRSLIESACYSDYAERSRPIIKALPEGTLFEAKQVVMEIEWEFSKIVAFETAILGILSHCGTARAMYEIVQAAKGRPVFAFEARHFPPELAAMTACAAKLGGASGISSTTGAQAALDYRFAVVDPRYYDSPSIFAESPSGTTPHACSAVMPENEDWYRIDEMKFSFDAPADLPEVRCAEIFARIFPDKPALVLNDYSGRELDASRVAVQILSKYPNFWGVRCDTCGERFHQGAAVPTRRIEEGIVDPLRLEEECAVWEGSVRQERKWQSGRGVTVELARNVRRVMDEAGGRKAKIMLSSGFDAEKTKFFDENDAPFDAIGTGSFVKFHSLTSDIVAIQRRKNDPWTQRVKCGREWLAQAPLVGLKQWEWY